jgi:hypothetical protein
MIVCQAAMMKRHVKARNCDTSAFTAARKAKRALARRQVEASSTASAAQPHYTDIQKYAIHHLPFEKKYLTWFYSFTCVTAPEVTEGPYYINNEYIRSDLREDQP